MTDEDLTLLRLAAKAAGIPVQDGDDSTIQARPILVIPYNNHGMMTAFEWNPLQNDADAFKLIAKLRIDLYHSTNTNGRFIIAQAPGVLFCPEPLTEPNQDDAAIRRAVTRAAAEMAKKGT